MPPSSHEQSGRHPRMIQMNLNPDDLPAMFSQLDPDAQVALLYRLSLAARDGGGSDQKMPSREEAHKKGEELHYFLDLGHALQEFAQQAVHTAEHAKSLEQILERFGSKKSIAKRQDVLLMKNPHVQFVDTHARVLWEHYSRIRAIGSAAQEFLADWKAIHKKIERIQEEIQSVRQAMLGGEKDTQNDFAVEALALDHMDLLKELENHVLGFLGLTQHVQEFASEFVTSAQATQKDSQQYFGDMQWIYGERGDFDQDAFDHENMMRMWRGQKPKPPKCDVPIREQNVRWTGFLHEAVQQIPSLDGTVVSEKEEKKEGKEKNTNAYDDAKVVEYGEYLRSLADLETLHSVKESAFFGTMGMTIQGLHEHFAELDTAYQRTKVEEIQQKDPRSPKQKYEKKLTDTGKKIQPGGEKEKSFENFNPQSVTSYLGMVRFESIRTDPPVTEGEKERSKKHSLYAELFQKLEQQLIAMGQRAKTPNVSVEGPDPLSQDSVNAFVRELIDLKHELPDEQIKQEKKRKDRERMRKDKETGNVAFVPTVGIMDLRLQQIPTTNDRFEDLQGMSWTNVRKAIESIFAYGKHSHLWELGSPTERFNQHMLIFGPPGCGKSKFGRAFANFPGIVSVLTTTNRIGSPYIHEAEANVRRLWEQTYDMTREYEKPAGIFWDEFDTVTEGGDESVRGGSLKAMRKAVQMVLDGDVHYDGVSLIAFSNEPDKVPPEIYQRFGAGNIHLVRELGPGERSDLMRHWLAGIPVRQDFEEQAQWQEFMRLSNHAAGRIIGTVAQKCHRLFLERFLAKRPNHATTANKKFEELQQEGVHVTPEMKRKIYEARGGAKDIELYGDEFNIVMRQVLESDVVQAAKIAQEKFYDDYQKLLQRAHGNKFD